MAAGGARAADAAWQAAAPSQWALSQLFAATTVLDVLHRRLWLCDAGGAAAWSGAMLATARTLATLFAVDTVSCLAAHILRVLPHATPHLRALEAQAYPLCAALRPVAITLVDGFGLHDTALASVLGAHDGRVYERLAAWAAAEPLNATPVNATVANAMDALSAAGARVLAARL